MLCVFQYEKVNVGTMSARQRNPTKRTKKLSAPAHDSEVQAFYKACGVVNLVPATTLREIAKAFVEHVNEHGQIVTPIRFAGPPKKN